MKTAWKNAAMVLCVLFSVAGCTSTQSRVQEQASSGASTEKPESVQGGPEALATCQDGRTSYAPGAVRKWCAKWSTVTGNCEVTMCAKCMSSGGWGSSYQCY